MQQLSDPVLLNPTGRFLESAREQTSRDRNKRQGHGELTLIDSE